MQGDWCKSRMPSPSEAAITSSRSGMKRLTCWFVTKCALSNVSHSLERLRQVTRSWRIRVTWRIISMICSTIFWVEIRLIKIPRDRNVLISEEMSLRRVEKTIHSPSKLVNRCSRASDWVERCLYWSNSFELLTPAAKFVAKSIVS